MRAKKVLLFIFAAVLGLSLLSYARREIPVDGRLVLLDVLPMFGRKSIPVPTGEKRTAGETENADLPIERPARRRIAMNLQGKEIYTGQKIEQLRQIFGEPDRMQMGIYGLQWYIYHKDYSCFLMAAVSDGVVCGYYTNSAGFEIDGRAKADTCCGDWDPDIKLYRDKLDGDKVYAVFVVWEESKQSIDTTEREFLGIQARENFDVTNAFRVKKGLNPLLWDETAAEAARLHAIDMGKKIIFRIPRWTGERRLTAICAFARSHGVRGGKIYLPEGSLESIILTPGSIPKGIGKICSATSSNIWGWERLIAKSPPTDIILARHLSPIRYLKTKKAGFPEENTDMKKSSWNHLNSMTIACFPPK